MVTSLEWHALTLPWVTFSVTSPTSERVNYLMLSWLMGRPDSWCTLCFRNHVLWNMTRSTSRCQLWRSSVAWKKSWRVCSGACLAPSSFSLTSLLRHVRCTLIQMQHTLLCCRGDAGERNITSQRVISRGDATYEGVQTQSVPSTYFWSPVRFPSYL